jgi:hypothetical protein
MATGEVGGCHKRALDVGLVPGSSHCLGKAAPSHTKEFKGGHANPGEQTLQLPRSQQVMPETASRPVIHVRSHTAHRVPI